MKKILRTLVVVLSAILVLATVALAPTACDDGLNENERAIYKWFKGMKGYNNDKVFAMVVPHKEISQTEGLNKIIDQYGVVIAARSSDLHIVYLVFKGTTEPVYWYAVVREEIPGEEKLQYTKTTEVSRADGGPFAKKLETSNDLQRDFLDPLVRESTH